VDAGPACARTPPVGRSVSGSGPIVSAAPVAGVGGLLGNAVSVRRAVL